MTLGQFTDAWLPRVEATLDGLLPAADTLPSRLHEAMRYVLFPGGKRLRPMLALIGCEVTGGDGSRALPAAAAIELLHSYSLVHDDLPCVDDDDLRRGRPSCHKEYGQALAVLVGDALLTLAFETVVSAGAEAVRILGRAAGSRGMVGGQVVDLESQGADAALAARDDSLSLEQVKWIHDHKTGALITASLLIGAHAGGGDLSTLSALSSFGEKVGRAFQIADDCLDLTGTEQRLGKRPGQDLAARKLTYPAIMGLSGSRQAALDLASEAEELAETICSWADGGLESGVALLRDAARFAISRVS